MKSVVRALGALLMVSAMFAGGSVALAAQSAGATPLAAAGLPELTITLTDQGFQAPAETPGGRYLVTLDNQSKQDGEIDFTMLPSGTTVQNLITDFATPVGQQEQPLPAYVYKATIAGGPTAPAGQKGQAVVNLTEGTWVIWYGGQSTPKPVEMKVTKGTDPSAAPEPKAAVSVGLTEFSFSGLDQPVATGTNVWKLMNTGKQPHFLEIDEVPAGTTTQQIESLLTSGGPGTPPPNATPPPLATTIQFISDTSAISPGQSMWVTFTLQPGTYAALCFFPDEQTGMPHAMEGMVQVFTVQ
ncbi:MAG TPA: hypothetical protein VFL82_01280 [Thermomicrobiales bacterium]|nr:hypothetical protein [Thermomicrobiales bacterium]